MKNKILMFVTYSAWLWLLLFMAGIDSNIPVCAIGMFVCLGWISLFYKVNAT